ncbi:MFS transporter [Candidatus Coxiella mudrowiae]|uniref:MFS transporter n=1 Tax=Candidatus Coxiella mudrowiae TaxID=2054173 RepID=UPI001F2695DD|nr:MFS transporter [Candidatus Coxiella mudrowiae]
MFAAGIIPAALLLIGMLGLPYSPQWILSQDRDEKALWILQKLRGSVPEAKRELKQIRTTLQQQKGSWKALFSKIIQPTLIVGAGLAIFQQVTGYQYQYYSLLRS